MKIPALTAESGLGPASQPYAALSRDLPGSPAVAPAGLLDSLGGAFTGVLSKIPCLLGCGIPNVLAIAPRCGLDPACWLEQVGPAAAGCIQQCL